MIRATGVGSGIDVESIVSKLVAIERQPRDSVQQKRDELQVQLSAFGRARSTINQLAESIDGFTQGNRFGAFVAASSDENVFTATAANSADVEYHDIEVVQLSAAHQVSTQPFASRDSEPGVGEWSFSSGGNTFSLTVDGTNNSLTELRDAINDSSGNTSMVASILNVNDGNRLTLTAREGGTANEIAVSRTVERGGGFGGTDTFYPFSESREARDATLKVDGFTVTRPNNTITDVIDGVTLELKGIGSAELDTKRDIEGTNEKLDEFVERYNTLRSTFRELGENSLNGDRLTRNVELRMQRAFNDPLQLADGSTRSPTELGFTFDRYGELSIDAERMQDAQNTDMADFVEAFTDAQNGLAQRFASVLTEYTRPDGLIAGREEGIGARRRSYDSQLDRFDYRLTKIEQRYRQQFSNMDELLSQLQNTSNSLYARFPNDGG